jgi:hypothetical protein
LRAIAARVRAASCSAVAARLRSASSRASALAAWLPSVSASSISSVSKSRRSCVMATTTKRTSPAQLIGTPSSEAAEKRSTRSWRRVASPGASAMATEAPASMTRVISEGPPSHWR